MFESKTMAGRDDAPRPLPQGSGAISGSLKAFGATDLAQVGNNYFLFAHGTSSGPELSYNGAPVTVGEFGAFSPIGAEKTASGYEVAWKMDNADVYGIWYTDNNGNWVSSPAGGLSGTSIALENFEVSFQQDLNHDNVIGLAPGAHAVPGLCPGGGPGRGSGDQRRLGSPGR